MFYCPLKYKSQLIEKKYIERDAYGWYWIKTNLSFTRIIFV